MLVFAYIRKFRNHEPVPHHRVEQGMKTLLASGYECLIEVGPLKVGLIFQQNVLFNRF